MSPVSVTAENFEELKKGGAPILLHFWASSCIPCKLMKGSVAKAASCLGDEALIGLVNVDEEAALVERFGVRGTPTFVLIQGDEVLNTFFGLASASTLATRVRESMKEPAVMPVRS